MGDGSVITCKVTGVRPFFDPYGNEYVCVEFGVEAQRPPTVAAMPTNVPQELSAIMPILSQIPRMMPQPKLYIHRLVLYLTSQEWERLQRKYQYGDEVEIKVASDGTIQLKLVA